MHKAAARLCSLHSHLSAVNSIRPALRKMSSKTPPPPEFNFPLSEVPKRNPLGQEGRYIKTAAALVIG